MIKISTKSNVSGMSLIEAVIAMAILAIAGVAFMTLSQNMNNLQSEMQRKQDETELRAEIMTILNNEEFCTVSLAGLNPLTNPVTFQKQNIDGNPANEGLNIELFFKTGNNRTKKFSATDAAVSTYGKIRIDSLRLQMNNGQNNTNYADAASHSDVGRIVLSYTRLNNTAMPPKEIDFPINLTMKTELQVSKILSCRAVSQSDPCGPLGMKLDSAKGLCRYPKVAIASEIFNNEGNYGTYGAEVRCANDTLVCGLKTSVEADIGAGDDTGMNAARLACCNNLKPFGFVNSSIIQTNNESGWGEWGELELCPVGSYVIGFKTKILPFQCSGYYGACDDTSMNGLELLCSDVAGTTIRSSEYPKGVWSPVVKCPAGQFVCGFHSKNESSRDDGDDTAMNGIKLRCCTVTP